MRISDPLEQAAVQAVAGRALELRQRVDERLAVLIANAVGQMLKG